MAVRKRKEGIQFTERERTFMAFSLGATTSELASRKELGPDEVATIFSIMKKLNTYTPRKRG